MNIFKYQLFSLTGVEPERQKILVKGSQLKDDTDLSKLNIKRGRKPDQPFFDPVLVVDMAAHFQRHSAQKQAPQDQKKRQVIAGKRNGQ